MSKVPIPRISTTIPLPQISPHLLAIKLKLLCLFPSLSSYVSMRASASTYIKDLCNSMSALSIRNIISKPQYSRPSFHSWRDVTTHPLGTLNKNSFCGPSTKLAMRNQLVFLLSALPKLDPSA